VDETDFRGYTVRYAKGETQFPVYLLTFLATILIAGAIVGENVYAFLFGLAAAGFAYYFYPMLETSRPVIGANEYGIFIQAFGILKWRAVKKIDLVPVAVRAMTTHHLKITLDQPLGSALVADWRQLPFWRRGMRLLWSMSPDNSVTITLDPLDQEPDEIYRTCTRMWRYYRS